MLFEIVNRYGETVMRTNYMNCMPSAATLSSMYSGGYTFRFKGKAVSLKKIKELIENEEKEIAYND